MIKNLNPGVHIWVRTRDLKGPHNNSKKLKKCIGVVEVLFVDRAAGNGVLIQSLEPTGSAAPSKSAVVPESRCFASISDAKAEMLDEIEHGVQSLQASVVRLVTLRNTILGSADATLVKEWPF